MAGLMEPSQWRGAGGKKGGEKGGEERGGEGRGRRRGKGKGRGREGEERVKKDNTAYAIPLLLLPHPRAPIPDCTHIRSTRAA